MRPNNISPFLDYFNSHFLLNVVLLINCSRVANDSVCPLEPLVVIATCGVCDAKQWRTEVTHTVDALKLRTGLGQSCPLEFLLNVDTTGITTTCLRCKKRHAANRRQKQLFENKILWSRNPIHSLSQDSNGLSESTLWCHVSSSPSDIDESAAPEF